ncbi:MAG: DUF3592 domain-containing protein [Phycisphaeraceae bacterium]|nr:DUF3592 domain-containing protein [Phycisphaeraceae bacterium]
MTRTTFLPNAERRKADRQLWFGGAFVLCWSILVLGFDGLFAWTAFRQIRTEQTWQQTTATITASSVVTDRGSKGSKTYFPRIAYAYTVGDTTHTGKTIQIGGAISSGIKAAERTVRDFPVGSIRPVFVDPANPANSALRVGLQPSTLMMLAISLPFNAIMIGAFAFLVRVRRFARDPMADWVRRDDVSVAVLRLAQWSPMTAACLTMVVISFVGLMGVMVLYQGDPPLVASAAVIGASLGGFVLSYFVKMLMDSSGRRDVLFDRTLKRISLPRRSGEIEEASLRFDQLAVSIGPDSNRVINNQPAWKLVLGDQNETGLFTLCWLSRQDARRIADWIARECGVSVRVVGRDEDEEEDSDAESLTSRPKS